MDTNPLHLFCGLEEEILARVFTDLQYRHANVMACHHLTELESCIDAGTPALLALSADFALGIDAGLSDLLNRARPRLLLIAGSEAQRERLLAREPDLRFLFLPADYDVPAVLLLLDAFLESLAVPRASTPSPVGDHEIAFGQLHKILGVGTWEVDLESGNGIWSPEMYELFDLPPGRRNIDFEAFIDRIHPDDRSALVRARESAIRGEAPLDIQHRIVTGGTTRWVREYGELIRDADGRPKRFAGIILDISHTMALTQQLHRASQHEALGQLVSGVAHNFNNLLTVIMGNAEDLADKLLYDQALSRQLDLIADSSRRGAQLIRELIVYSRQRQIQTESVEINQLIQRLQRLLDYTLGRGIRLTVHSEVDRAVARIDPAKLENSLIGLTLNAREALNSQGEIAIIVEKLDPEQVREEFPELPEAGYVAVRVRDQGPGMPAEVLAHVTEPFFTTKSPGQSSGLGLAEIRAFLEQSRGHLHIQSEVGRGTTATMLLPGSDRITLDLEPRLDEDGDEPKHLVIVAVDDTILRRNTADRLAATGYRVIEAGDAAQAQSALLDNPNAAFLIWHVDQYWSELGNRVIQGALGANPRLRVLLTAPEGEALAAESTRFALLHPPLSADVLANAVNRMAQATAWEQE